MALRRIIKIGDPVLREKSRPVTVFDARLHTLLDDMQETMLKADGVGLAAVQVGSLQRACIVIDDESTTIELVNPVIIKSSGEQFFDEGCLSILEYKKRIRRPLSIKVRYFDRFGKQKTIEANGYFAVIISHELDHLDGVLIADLPQVRQ